MSATITYTQNASYYMEIGDYIITPQFEGYVIGVNCAPITDGGKHYCNHIQVLDVFNQKRFTVRHVTYLDQDAPEGRVNDFLLG